MGKTTVKKGNPYLDEGGRMPSTTGTPSGGKRGKNPHHLHDFSIRNKKT